MRVGHTASSPCQKHEWLSALDIAVHSQFPAGARGHGLSWRSDRGCQPTAVVWMRAGGIPGLWLLLPGDSAAMIDDKPVPLIGPGQRARIPYSWLQNLHRGNGKQQTAGKLSQ